MSARGWVYERTRGAPHELAERCASSLESDVMPDALVAAAFDRLRVVVQGDGSRSSAWDLLTADALLTLACEYADTEEALAHLVELCSPARFAALLAESQA